ncbi:hypothetical protein UT300002_27210 [Clostridium perfringens]
MMTVKKSMIKKTNKNKLNDGTLKEYNYYLYSTYELKNNAKCSRYSIKLEILEESVLKAIQIQIAIVEI